MKRNTVKRLLAILLILTMAIGLAACGGGTQNAASTEADESKSAAVDNVSSGDVGDASKGSAGGTLKIGMYSGLDTMDPFVLGRSSKTAVLGSVYETLFVLERGTGDLVPVMVSEYTQQDDVTYEVTLYDYIYDVAGNNITAEDVKWCYEQYLAAGNVLDLEEIEVTDTYTLVFHLTSAAPGTINMVASAAFILSKNAGESLNLSTTTCGTIGYTCTSFVEGASITLEKEADFTYWQTDADKAYAGSVANADVIEFHILTEPTQLALAVEQGTVDLAIYVDPSMLDEVLTHEHMVADAADSREDRGIMFCMTEDSPFYDNQALRQAVLYAIDNEAVALACAYGYGSATTTVCGGEGVSIGYNPEWETDRYHYDPDKARELLAEAGYAEGELTLRCLCNNNSAITMMWQVIQSNLRDIGIEAKIDTVDGTTYGAYRDGTSGMYDIAYGAPSKLGYFTQNCWNTLFNRNNYDSGLTWFGLADDHLQELYDALTVPGGYTQENLDAFYYYIEEGAWYYQIYDMAEYAVYNDTTIASFSKEYSGMIMANTVLLINE